VEELIDRFHRVMPRDPVALRDAAVRRDVAKEAVPVLRAIRTFLAENPTASLAPRGLEFTIYALVLGDETARVPLQKLAAAGDASARLLLDCSDVIAAADAKQRAHAVGAVAAGLGDGKQAATSEAVQCATMCLVTAAALSEAEAQQLAKSTPVEAVAKRFQSAAAAAVKDPRRLLDQPFELKGKLLSGEAFSTKSLLGKVVLVDFWATWCGPCVRALPEIVKCRQQYGPRGLEVVGISCDRDEAELRKFLGEHPELAWPQLFEPGQKGFHPLAEAMGVTAIPRLFLVDKKGVLRSVDAHDKLDELIVRLLAE
jgi:thiol-disulfide isomerase/thioredoxin